MTGVDWSRNQEILILVLSVWPWASHISSPSVFLKLSQGVFSVCGWRVYYNISESHGALGFVGVVGGTCGQVAILSAWCLHFFAEPPSSLSAAAFQVV